MQSLLDMTLTHDQPYIGDAKVGVIGMDLSVVKRSLGGEFVLYDKPDMPRPDTPASLYARGPICP
jgi:hypothetical protein